MSATEKGQLNNNLKKLGIIAGAGALPLMLAQEAEREHIQPVIIAFEWTDPALLENRTHIITHFGAVGDIFNFLKSNDVRDVVFTGAMKRPKWRSVKPDAAGFKILIKLAMKSLGDDALLKNIRAEFEQRGFALRPIQDFLPTLLTPTGCLTSIIPSPDDWETIRLGFHA